MQRRHFFSGAAPAVVAAFQSEAVMAYTGHFGSANME